MVADQQHTPAFRTSCNIEGAPAPAQAMVRPKEVPDSLMDPQLQALLFLFGHPLSSKLGLQSTKAWLPDVWALKEQVTETTH